MLGPLCVTTEVATIGDASSNTSYHLVDTCHHQPRGIPPTFWHILSLCHQRPNTLRGGQSPNHHAEHADSAVHARYAERPFKFLWADEKKGDGDDPEDDKSYKLVSSGDRGQACGQKLGHGGKGRPDCCYTDCYETATIPALNRVPGGLELVKAADR